VAMYVAIAAPVVGVGSAVYPLGLPTAAMLFCAAMSLVALAACVMQLRSQRA